MTLPSQLFLDGAFREGASGQRTTLINPATEEAFASVAAAGSRTWTGPSSRPSGPGSPAGAS